MNLLLNEPEHPTPGVRSSRFQQTENSGHLFNYITLSVCENNTLPLCTGIIIKYLCIGQKAFKVKIKELAKSERQKMVYENSNK